jgi:hypothetical protein
LNLPSFEVEKNCDLVCGRCTCHPGNSKKIVAPSFEVEKNCDLVCGCCTCHQGNSNKKKLFTAPRNRTRDMARRTERE